MKSLIRWLRNIFLQITHLLAHADSGIERQRFGLGQFVLLLTLVPFIFNLNLYSFGKPEVVPSHYEYSPERFEPLPIYDDQLKKKNLKKPKKPTRPTESFALKQCRLNPLHQLFHAKQCNKLRRSFLEDNRAYAKNYRQYTVKLKAFNDFKSKEKNYKQYIKKEYKNFDEDTPKPTLDKQEINVKDSASSSINGMISSHLAGNDWLKITLPLWLLGAFLIVPTIVLGVKRRLWGLVVFGLAIPCFNYFVAFPAKIFDPMEFSSVKALAELEVTSLLVPQIGFLWFVLKGHIRSKSFIYFIFLLLALTFLPIFTDDTSYSIFQAHLPILAFVLASCMGRLLVKIIQENAYLFNNLGWRRSLTTLAHAIVLWIPIALLAVPFFYVTEIVFPKHVVDQLHEKSILEFNHTHDLLDNALQSSAVKTDDVIYDWYVMTQLIKKDIYQGNQKIQTINLKQTVQQTFDRVVPEELVFDNYESDAGFIREEIVEISVDAAQNSTNKAYKNLRKKLRKQLSRLAKQHSAEFKKATAKGQTAALTSIDDLYQQGVDSLLTTNETTQGALWWSINYARTAHQISILVFIFICIKSLMYVFARVSFNRDTGTFVTLGDTKNKQALTTQANITRTGLNYLIQGDRAQTFFISRRFQCRGKAPKFKIPQPLRAPFARIFNGAYGMNEVVMDIGDDTVSCTAAQGIEFFEWDLRDGESIVFDFHNFVGMSESVQVSTLISTRISSLLIGHMIYSQATGPGKLILMTKGRAEITDSTGNGGSLPPERLVAMQTNTRLHIDSELDIVNIYLSSAYVRPAGGGQVIVDVDSQRGNKAGLMSFLKRFILPV